MENIDPLKMAESLEPEQLNEKTLNDMRSDPKYSRSST